MEWFTVNIRFFGHPRGRENIWQYECMRFTASKGSNRYRHVRNSSEGLLVYILGVSVLLTGQEAAGARMYNWLTAALSTLCMLHHVTPLYWGKADFWEPALCNAWSLPCFLCFEAIGEDDRGGVSAIAESVEFLQWKTLHWTAGSLVVNVEAARPSTAAVVPMAASVSASEIIKMAVVVALISVISDL